MTTAAGPPLPGLADLVVVQHEHGLEASLNRPERRNALGPALRSSLHAVCDELEQRPQPLVLSSAVPGVFAAGADLEEMAARTPEQAAAGEALRLFDRIAALPAPTVALVGGPALGGAAELVYACDIRVGTAEAVFGQPEVRLGILAGAGGLYRLPKIVGDGRARDWLLTGRRVDAHEALAAGLLSRIVEPDALADAGQAVLADLARASSEALVLTKRVLAAPDGAHPHVDLLAQGQLFALPERRRRMLAFLERG